MLLRGAVAGLAISAPVGPVNVLCVSRTISKGPRAGLISGLGAAAADTFYGAIAGFSISIVIGLLVRNVFWIRLVGGVLLIGIGAVYYRKRPEMRRRRRVNDSAHSDFATAFLLNLTNPTTVLSFLAVLAGLGMRHQCEWWLTLVLIGGVFAGAMIWWSFLALLANRFRERFSTRGLVWMNRIGGFAVGGFGLAMILMALYGPR